MTEAQLSDIQVGVIIALFTAISGFIFFLIRFCYQKRKKIFHYLIRKKLIFFPINFDIGVFIKYEIKTNTELYKIKILENLTKILSQNGLEKQLKIKDYSEIKTFSSKTEAENFREKKDANLILWGELEDDSLRVHGEKICKTSLKFTYGYLENTTGQIGPMLRKDINSGLAIKQYWQIVESESLRDVKIVSENTWDIAIYILSKTLIFYGEIDKSITLLEKLLLSQSSRNAFSLSAEGTLIYLYSIKAEDLRERKKYIEAKEVSNKILKLMPDNVFALTSLSVISYHLGDIDETERLVNTVLSLHPMSPVTHLNVAFIRVLQKRYVNAFKHYMKVVSFREPDFNPVEIFDFLNKSYYQHREPAFRYAAGIIYYHFGDRDLGVEELKEFLKKADGERYKKMRKHTQRLVSTI